MNLRKLKRVVIKEELVALTKNHVCALILNQFLYWSERTGDTDKFLKEEMSRNPELGKAERATKPPGGHLQARSHVELCHGWVYKKADELASELMLDLNATTIRRYIAKLVDLKLLSERHNPLKKYDRTMQYRPNIIEIQNQLQALGYALEGYLLYPNARANLQNADSNLQNADSNLQNAGAITEITSEITSEISSPLTPQRELGEEKYMKKRSRQQNPTPSPAQPPWLETQLQPLSSQANPNQDQTPPLSLDDDKKLKSTNLSQTPSLARKKTESNALAEAAQQDTQRSLEDNGASSAATDSITRQRPRLLPWRNSAVANDYHEEFVEYLATHHLPYCSIYRHSGKQPTKGDAKNWILDREAKGELARIENKWEDYQARKVNCNTQTLPTERELTIWEQQMRLQYEQERSLSTQPQKELSRQELLAELEASKTKRRNRGWL